MLTEAVRVVVVDDSPFDRSLIAHWLADDGSCVIVGEAADGDEAAEVASQEHPDVVVLDLSMPRVGGLAAIAEVAEAVPGVRIVVTSTGDADTVRQAVADTGARFVSKDTPFALRRAVLGEDASPFAGVDGSVDALWAMVRNVPFPVAACGRDGVILRVNDPLCDLVGSPAVRLLDHPCDAFLVPDDSPGAARLRDDLWSGRQASYSAERRVRRADGSLGRVMTRWWTIDDPRFWNTAGLPTVAVVAVDPLPS